MKKKLLHVFGILLIPLIAFAQTPYTIRSNSDMTKPPAIGSVTATSATFSIVQTTVMNFTTGTATTLKTSGMTISGPVNHGGAYTGETAFISTTNTTTLNATTGNFTTVVSTTAHLAGATITGNVIVRGVELPYILTVGGTGNAWTMTPSPAISGYSNGQSFSFAATTVNTGAVTLNVSGIGVKDVKKVIYDGVYTALQSGDVLGKKVITVIYSKIDDVFIMQSQHQTQDHPLGEFWMTGNTTVTVNPGAGVFGAIGGNAYANTANSQFSFSSTATNSNKMTYTGVRTEVAHTAVTATIKSSGATDTATLALYKNGSALANGVSTTRLAAAGAQQTMMIHAMTALAPNDVFEVYVHNDAATILTIVNLNLFVMGVTN